MTRGPDSAPLAISHRGGAGLWPENTMEAFSRSVALGYRWIETDLHLTSDGVPVCFHDPTLSRTTNGQGEIKDLAWGEVQELDAGYHHHPDRGFPFRAQGVRVPSLEEVAGAFPDLHMVLELKADHTEEPVLRLIRRMGLTDRVIVASFSDAPAGPLGEAVRRFGVHLRRRGRGGSLGESRLARATGPKPPCRSADSRSFRSGSAGHPANGPGLPSHGTGRAGLDDRPPRPDGKPAGPGRGRDHDRPSRSAARSVHQKRILGTVTSLSHYDSDQPRRLVISEIANLRRYRGLLALLVRRDLTVRYKRSMLGVWWTLLNPLLTVAVMWAVFSTVFRFEIPGDVPYVVYVLSGVMLITFFSQGVVASGSSIVDSAGILSKVYVPAEVFAVAPALAALVNFGINILLLLVVQLIAGGGGASHRPAGARPAAVFGHVRGGTGNDGGVFGRGLPGCAGHSGGAAHSRHVRHPRLLPR